MPARVYEVDETNEGKRKERSFARAFMSLSGTDSVSCSLSLGVCLVCRNMWFYAFESLMDDNDTRIIRLPNVPSYAMNAVCCPNDTEFLNS